MNIDPAVLSAVVISAGGVIVSQITNRNNRRGQAATLALQTRQSAAANKVESDRVDREEFDSLTREMRNSIEDLKDGLKHEREQRKLSNEYARTLARVLRDNGMPVPQPPVDLDLL